MEQHPKQHVITVAVMIVANVVGVAVAQPSHGERGAIGERMIERFDQDGDGVLSLEEFGQRERRVDRFSEADADGDGAVTLSELEAHMSEQASSHYDRAIEHFGQMDMDGDGQVTPVEREASVFAAMDDNDDGFLSADEIRPPRHHRRRRADRGVRERAQEG